MFAEKMGYGTVHMSNMMRGHKKGGADTFSFLEKAAKVLNVPVTQLLPLDESASQYVYLNDLSGNFPNLAFKSEWINKFNSEEFFVELMPDESMLPTIKIGDALLVAKRDSISRDGIYIFKNSGNIIVRRITAQLNNQFVIHSDNNLIHPVTLHKNEIRAILQGQVVWLGRTL